MRIVKYWPLNDAYREDNQHNQERTLSERARPWVFYHNRFGRAIVHHDFDLGEEKKPGAQAKLLDIEPNKYMVDCFREEEPAGVAGGRLIVDPSEKVFVQQIEQKEGDKREAIDDRSYDRIAQRDNNQLGYCGEESTPCRCAGQVLGLVHRARGERKESLFDIIHHQRPNLKESKGCPGKPLKYDETITSNKTAIEIAK